MKPINRKADDYNPIYWSWPSAPPRLELFDKYRGINFVVEKSQATWRLLQGGEWRNIHFSSGEEGELQRHLALLTQKTNGPQSLYRFATTVVAKWATVVKFLKIDPVSLQQEWRDCISDVATAVVVKAVLTEAARNQLGAWKRIHLPQIKSQSTKARESLSHQKTMVNQRVHLLPASTQSKIIAILDEASLRVDFEPKELEGLVALAMLYQFAMRPVQVLTVKCENVRLEPTVGGRPVCTIGFEQAKRKTGEAIRGLTNLAHRSVRPEWAPLYAQLLKNSQASGNRRLFSCTNRTALLSSIRRAFKLRGYTLDFLPKQLRHTGGQSLADAGESRESIQKFLTHKNKNASTMYHSASVKFGERINNALATSAVYNNILNLANATFVSVEQVMAAPEDQQIGGIVGDRLVAGIGMCRSGQKFCPSDPVVGCYGCSKHIPSLDIDAHLEAIAGMRAQVVAFIDSDEGTNSSPLMQLRDSINRAKEIVEEARLRRAQ